MEKNNKTAEAMVGKFVKMSWDHEYAENGVLSKDDAVLFANTYASLQSSDKDERIKELEDELFKINAAHYYCEGDYRAQRDEIKRLQSVVVKDKERIVELESALKSAWKCINYLGDVLNSIDATTAENVEFTDPLISEVRSALTL